MKNYIYSVRDDEGKILFEGRVGFVAEMLNLHPYHVRNLGVDMKRIKFNDAYVTITRKEYEK